MGSDGLDIVVELCDVCKDFYLGDNVVHALSDINIKIKQNEVTTIIGSSGSGKSTFMNLVGALDIPTKGKVIVEGQDLSSLNLNQKARFRNKNVGFVFQNFNLVPVLSSFENVVLPAQLSSLDFPYDIEERAKELLCTVGLEKQMYQGVNKLSGGQMQRVALARALMNKPHIILADEPTANLDHVTSGKILQLMKDMSQKEGTSIIISTHDRTILEYSDRIVELSDGRMISDSSPV